MNVKNFLLVFACIFNLAICGCGKGPNISQEKTKAISMIEDDLGGKVKIDFNQSNLPVIGVNFSGAGIADSDLAILNSFSQLHNLDLANTNITNEGLTHVYGLTQLQSINLGGTKVTKDGIDKLKQTLPNCSVIIAKEAQQIDGKISNQEETLSFIERIGGKIIRDQKDPEKPVIGVILRDCDQVTDASIANLKSLHNIQMLDIVGTKVTDDGLSFLKNFPQLQMLFIGNSGFTNNGIAYLKNFPNLYSLMIGGSNINDTTLIYIKEISQLKRLKLIGTKITNAGLAKLRQLMPNCSIEIYEESLDMASSNAIDKFTEKALIECIESIGGDLIRDTEQPGQPVQGVIFNNCANDDDLVLLQGIPELKTLVLVNTKVTDLGLEHLKKIPSLRMLFIRECEISDAGLIQLQALPLLQWLSLTETKVSDDGLAHLKKFPALQILSLDFNDNITDAGLMHIKDLPKILILYLNYSQLTDVGLSYFEGLSQLQQIDLTGTYVTNAGVQKLRQKLPNCEVVFKTDSEVAVSLYKRLGAEFERNLQHPDKPITKINFLNGSDLDDEDLEHIKEFPHLIWLYLVDTKVTDAGLKHLNEVPKLGALAIINSTAVTDAGLANLTGLSQLQMLALVNTSVSDTGLEHLKNHKNISILMLPGNKGISDVGLAHLQGLTQLKQLNLTGTQVSNVGIEKLRHALPNCDIEPKNVSRQGTSLDEGNVVSIIQRLGGEVERNHELPNQPVTTVKFMDCENFTDADLAHLQRLPYLRFLAISNTRVTDSGLEYIKKLSQLRILIIQSNLITDNGLAHLGEMSQLGILNIVGNSRVTDTGLVKLKNLKKLQMLAISKTSITDSGLYNFREFPQLEILSLIGNPYLTDYGIVNLKGLSQLKRLDLAGPKVTASGLERLQQALPNCNISTRPGVSLISDNENLSQNNSGGPNDPMFQREKDATAKCWTKYRFILASHKSNSLDKYEGLDLKLAEIDMMFVDEELRNHIRWHIDWIKAVRKLDGSPIDVVTTIMEDGFLPSLRDVGNDSTMIAELKKHCNDVRASLSKKYNIALGEFTSYGPLPVLK